MGRCLLLAILDIIIFSSAEEEKGAYGVCGVISRADWYVVEVGLFTRLLLAFSRSSWRYGYYFWVDPGKWFMEGGFLILFFSCGFGRMDSHQKATATAWEAGRGNIFV